MLDLSLFLESLLIVMFTSLGALTREFLVRGTKKGGAWTEILATGMILGLIFFLGKDLLPANLHETKTQAFLCFMFGLVGYQIVLILLKKPGVIGAFSPATKKIGDEINDQLEKQENQRRSK